MAIIMTVNDEVQESWQDSGEAGRGELEIAAWSSNERVY